MSVDLSVKPRQEVSYQTVLDMAAKNVQQILRLPECPSISCWSAPIDPSLMIGQAKFDDIIFLADFSEHILEIGTIFVPTTPGWEDPAEEGWWFGVTMRASRNDQIKGVLFLATITAFAASQEMPIIDDGGYFKRGVNQYDAVSIVQFFTLPEPAATFEDALERFAVIYENRGMIEALQTE